MKFEWDEEKSIMNKRKHRISFEEATAVFEDTKAITIYDEEHSEYEERFIVIGIDLNVRELAVCHCYRGYNDDTIRIISARKATKNEINLYRRKQT